MGKGGGGWGPTKNPKINKQGGLLFGTGEYYDNKQNQNLNTINLEAEVFLGKSLLKLCSKFTREHRCPSVIQ